MNIHQWGVNIKDFNKSFDGRDDVKKEWNRNTEMNIPIFNKKNSIWNLLDLYTDEKEKCAVLVGASPALLRDIDKLKNLDDNFYIVCSNSSLKTLLKHDIKPEFCICLDSDLIDIPQHLDCDNKDITLLASTTIAPEALAKWKGPVYFQPYYAIDNKLKPKVRYRLGKRIIGGGNSISQALYIVTILFNCKTVIFVGNEFCFDDSYYGDRDIAKQEILHTKFYVTDVKGRQRYTLPALYVYAMWIDKTCGDLSPPGFFIDTSFGLLSTTNKAIHVFDLDEAIKRVKWAYEKKKELNEIKVPKEQLDAVIGMMKINEPVKSPILRYNYADHRKDVWRLGGFRVHDKSKLPDAVLPAQD